MLEVPGFLGWKIQIRKRELFVRVTIGLMSFVAWFGYCGSAAACC